MPLASELNQEEKKYLKAVKNLYKSPFVSFTPGQYTLHRWYPIGLLLSIFILTIVVPLYILSLYSPSLAVIERTHIAQVILVFSVVISALSIFYLKAIVQKHLVLEKDKTVFVNSKALDYNTYQYIRYYTVQTSKYSGPKPSMIVFSNIRNDIWRFLIASYFPFFSNTKVVHVYKIKNTEGKQIDPAELVTLIEAQCKKFQFQVSEMKKFFAISGWIAIKGHYLETN